eukprot:7304327-Ditylum_brightwellii.AAC.1
MLGMACSEENVVILFDAKGTIISFKSSAPSEEELSSLPCIVLTSKERWDPSNVNLDQCSKEEVAISMLLSNPLTNNTGSNMEHHDHNVGMVENKRSLSSVSRALSDDAFLPDMISNVHIA